MGTRITLKLQDSLTNLPEQLTSQMVKVVTEHLHACNAANARSLTCKFDKCCIGYLFHHCMWLRINKDEHYLSILDKKMTMCLGIK